MEDFALHPQLAADTLVVADWALSRVLLMNDARYPWLILVPRRAGVSELHELDEAGGQTLMAEIVRAGKGLKAATGAYKINTAALGNMVAQLHIHVIARHVGDETWPSPVWGRGLAAPYTAQAASALVERLLTTL